MPPAAAVVTAVVATSATVAVAAETASPAFNAASSTSSFAFTTAAVCFDLSDALALVAAPLEAEKRREMASASAA